MLSGPPSSSLLTRVPTSCRERYEALCKLELTTEGLKSKTFALALPENNLCGLLALHGWMTAAVKADAKEQTAARYLLLAILFLFDLLITQLNAASYATSSPSASSPSMAAASVSSTISSLSESASPAIALTANMQQRTAVFQELRGILSVTHSDAIINDKLMGVRKKLGLTPSKSISTTTPPSITSSSSSSSSKGVGLPSASVSATARNLLASSTGHTPTSRPPLPTKTTSTPTAGSNLTAKDAVPVLPPRPTVPIPKRPSLTLPVRQQFPLFDLVLKCGA
jgi:hypothetical protein